MPVATAHRVPRGIDRRGSLRSPLIPMPAVKPVTAGKEDGKDVPEALRCGAQGDAELRSPGPLSQGADRQRHQRDADRDHDRDLQLEGERCAPARDEGDDDDDCGGQELGRGGRDLTPRGRPHCEDRLHQTETVEGDAQSPAEKERDADRTAELEPEAARDHVILAADPDRHVGGHRRCRKSGDEGDRSTPGGPPGE